MNIMKTIGADLAMGDKIQLKTTNPRHFNSDGSNGVKKMEGTSFGEKLVEALNSANTAEQNSTTMMERMITDPDSVNVHDVTIASAKAELAVNLTKSVIDGAVKAYKDIISTR